MPNFIVDLSLWNPAADGKMRGKDKAGAFSVVTIPVWGTIPDRSVAVGQAMGISLGTYISNNGGDANITFGISSGTLPAGISLNPNGTFTGTATTEAAGVNIVYTATNSAGIAVPNAGHTVTVSAAVAGTANIQLQIVQPLPNLDTTNRFYKAYPGLEYNVRMAILGGSYPFNFYLDTAPTGMTIDARGEISWPNPVEAGSPHSITARVVDLDGTAQTVSWTLTVTTAGFLFVDAVNGTTTATGGTGTLANPWKTMKDVYGGDDYDSKWATFHAGEFVYWRAGTYILDAYMENLGAAEPRVPLLDNKAVVWINYPNETPQINFNSGTRDGYLSFQGTPNAYIDGFDLNNNGNTRGKTLSPSGSRLTIRKNIFRGLTNCNAAGGNASQLMLSGNLTHTHNAIQDNTFNTSCTYAVLGYDHPYTVIEDNIITDNTQAISPKDSIQNWSIRNNTITSVNNDKAIYIQEYSPQGPMENIEVCFNTILLPAVNDVAVRVLSSDPSGSIFFDRNTIKGQVEVQTLTATKGPWEVSKNVIINNSVSVDKITRTGNGVDESRLIIDDNLTGVDADNIIDANGDLTAGYSAYLGTHGHEVV